MTKKAAHRNHDRQLAHIFNMQANAIKGGVEAALLAHQQHPESKLAAWLTVPDHHLGTPAQVMLHAADLVKSFATGQAIDQTAASTSLTQMEVMRDRLSSIFIGKVVDDIELRNSSALTPVAKEFATVLTRCCRVLTSVLDDGTVPAHVAKAAGLRLSTRQAVELAVAQHQ